MIKKFINWVKGLFTINIDKHVDVQSVIEKTNALNKDENDEQAIPLPLGQGDSCIMPPRPKPDENTLKLEKSEVQITKTTEMKADHLEVSDRIKNINFEKKIVK